MIATKRKRALKGTLKVTLKVMFKGTLKVMYLVALWGVAKIQENEVLANPSSHAQFRKRSQSGKSRFDIIER